MAALGVALALLGGCASSSESIQASYVSPVLYQGLSCEQLAAEAQRVSYAAVRAAGEQDQKATSDAVATGVALVIFWPAALLVSGGDGHTAAELANLRGQMKAIEEANLQKSCGLNFTPMQPAPVPNVPSAPPRSST